VITFAEAPASQPQPVRYWYYPGRTLGHEFIDPMDQARRIARMAKTPVLGTDAKITVYQVWQDRALERALEEDLPERMRRLDRIPVDGVPPGSVLGRLEIPRLGFSAIIREGEDPGTLRLVVGHLPGTAWPGQPGNAALAGHRDTFFRPLRQHPAPGRNRHYDVEQCLPLCCGFDTDRSSRQCVGVEEHCGGHLHEALDILAPRGTTVVAIEEGRIARLFFSQAGGAYHLSVRSDGAVRLLLLRAPG
jgi:hypothetical protein